MGAEPPGPPNFDNEEEKKSSKESSNGVLPVAFRRLEACDGLLSGKATGILTQNEKPNHIRPALCMESAAERATWSRRLPQKY
jgi:hypothetical protein